MSHLCKKIKFEEQPTSWSHHRGGWSYAFQTLSDLCAPDGVLCVSATEELVCDDKVIEEPWVGFVHQAPVNNYEWYPDLQRLVQSETFTQSLKKCCGLFTLSSVVKGFLVKNLPNTVPVARIFYPMTPFPKEKAFDWNKYSQAESKTVVFIGEYLRKYQSFFDLVVPKGYRKLLLKAPDVKFDELLDCNKRPYSLKLNETVTIQQERVSDDEYDDLLSSSIVFLDLYDAVGNTTTIECLGRSTPLLVNRLPGMVEYLGEKYPLFYDSLEEAAALLADETKLLEGAVYLRNHVSALQSTSPQSFLESFANSSIYRSLPLPPSQCHDPHQTKFPHFDVTVVMCCYKRVYNLKRQLDCFKQQDYPGTFEFILWNNNTETQKEVADIVVPYLDELHIHLIQSTTNYYCIIRLAVARLMQSDLLLICDDDVIPKPCYISTFMAKYKEYGPRAALCCRGHVFTQEHSLNEEQPELFWKSHENGENSQLKFCHQKVPDRQVSVLLLLLCKQKFGIIIIAIQCRFRIGCIWK